MNNKYLLGLSLFILVGTSSISASHNTWRDTWRWYPGQLAAYKQKFCKDTSEKRCVNVGYPGRFNPMSTVTWLRCQTRETPRPGTWKATGRASFNRDGKWLIVKLETDSILPAFIANFSASNWQASLDGKTWNLTETDPRFDNPQMRPDRRLEKVTGLKPRKIIPLRNVKMVNDSILMLGRLGSVVLDYHELEIGTVSTIASGKAHLRFYVGESMEEVNCDDNKVYEQYGIPTIAVNGHGMVTLPERAIRYVRITTDEPVNLTMPRFDALKWPVEENTGLQFLCSDDTINTLYRAGVATLHTSMHDFCLDGIKRDFLPWSMDAILSSMATNYVFGDRQVARNNLSIALMPPSPTAKDWGIVDYPLHALIGLKAYEQRFGDDGTAEMFRDRIIAQLQLYMDMQDSHGFITATQTTSGFIPGWSKQNGPNTLGTAAYPQMMLYENFRIAERLAKRWSKRQLAKVYKLRAELLKKNIMKYFWDDSRHAFINGFESDGSEDRRLAHYTQYWAVLTGLYPVQYYPTVYTDVMEKLNGYRSYISYDRGYDALAAVKSGNTERLHRLLVDVWYRWLEEDNTRFPENFSVYADIARQLKFYSRPYGLSMCHGASGVPPVVLVMNGILGFSVNDAGEYTIAPNLLGMEWAKGRIPVKEGFIEVELRAGEKPVVKCSRGIKVITKL